MKFWLFNTGEPLLHEGARRPGRTLFITRRLLAQGHQVDWWGTTYSHLHKRHWFQETTILTPEPGLRLLLFHGPGYQRNVSLRRVRHHQIVADAMAEHFHKEARPDAILATMPTIEVCHATVEFGRRTGVPVALDLIDMWPDIFLESVPRPLRLPAYPIIALFRRQLREACRGANALWGITPEFVDWGLRLAGRERGPQDRHFWHTYSPAQIQASSADLEAARRHWRELGVIEDGGFLAVYSGVITNKLELDPIFEAARELERSHPRLKIVLCGTGDWLERSKRATTGLKNVCFPGWVDGAQLLALLQASSVGLAPYRNRIDFKMSVPTKIPEYLANGLPILSGLEGRLERLLQEEACGLFYRNGEGSDFQGQLLRLHDEPEYRATLAENARRLYQREFTEERVIGEVVKSLERLAGSSRGPTPNDKTAPAFALPQSS